MPSRLILKITSGLLFVLGILSAFSLISSFMSIAAVMEVLTASRESMQFMLSVLILGLIGFISLVLQFMAAVKGWKAAKGKDFPDNCKTYGIMLLILQIVSIIINVGVAGLTTVQIVSSVLGIVILLLYTKSASDLII